MNSGWRKPVGWLYRVSFEDFFAYAACICRSQRGGLLVKWFEKNKDICLDSALLTPEFMLTYYNIRIDISEGFASEIGKIPFFSPYHQKLRMMGPINASTGSRNWYYFDGENEFRIDEHNEKLRYMSTFRAVNWIAMKNYYEDCLTPEREFDGL
ncbi:hypothetical protein [Pontivivens insulae]|uniref:hypothetical protein n=1 Tax=Pontivivens insulae TaxID=1639689 RepID=UPI0011B237DC|nr:hypothetical protein [Pontivivens insulae]